MALDKSTFYAIGHTEVVTNIIPTGENQKEVINYIENEQYNLALYKLILYLLRDINERHFTTNISKNILADKLLDLLEKAIFEPQDIEKHTKELIKILVRYLKALKLEAIAKKDLKMIETLDDRAEKLRSLLA
jgi:hypothetical protein